MCHARLVMGFTFDGCVWVSQFGGLEGISVENFEDFYGNADHDVLLNLAIKLFVLR